MTVQWLTVDAAGVGVLHPKVQTIDPAAPRGVALVNGCTYGRLFGLWSRFGPPGSPAPVTPPHPVRLTDLAADACDAIVAAAASTHLDPTQLSTPSPTGQWGFMNASSTDPAASLVVELAANLLDAANASAYELQDLTLTSGQVLYYATGSSKAWHCDGALDPNHRWLGLIIALSAPDSYDGGELQIGRDGEPRKLDRGETLVIPGHVPHQVLPVTAGERWSLTAFAASAERAQGRR